MEDTRKIKEIYDCAAIVSDEELYPLQKWYNQLIDKTIYEITVPDVLRNIIRNALEKCALHEWAYDGEENELKQSLHLLEKKIIRFQVKEDKCLK